MKWTNYHSHTRYSDGSSSPEEYIQAAIEQGVAAYGFSCHAPVSFPCKWTIAHDEIASYFSEIDALKEKYRDKIQVYRSLEIDYFPGNPLSNPSLYSDLNLDYVIGSVHFVDNLKSGDAWNIDTSKRIFDDGMVEIFNGDGKAAVARFYNLTVEMIRLMRPTIVGHLDKIKMFNVGDKYFSEQEQWYRDVVELVLDIIKDSGCIVEVNTRGIYRSKTRDHYPSDYILGRCLALGIPVTLNSDCHKPTEVTRGFAEAAGMLRSLGFEKLRVLLDNKWVDVPFSHDGIELTSL